MPRTPVNSIFVEGLKFPLGLTSFKGINIPWLHYSTRGELSHDGYGNAFDDYYFTDKGADLDIKAQLNLFSKMGIRYARLWINMYAYMNADKDTVGYTSFQRNMLKNLKTFCDWCLERNIKLLICLDDCWYTFPWAWLPDKDKRASYIQAASDVVNSLKDHKAVWAWDYCNEPYMGWPSNVNATTHRHNNKDNDIGYTRATLTTFFKDMYVALKAIAPHHYFSVGDAQLTDIQNFDIASASDFYQLHWYGTDPKTFTYTASQWNKPVIIGEYGYSEASNYPNHDDFNKAVTQKMLQGDFPLLMLWASDLMYTKKAPQQYIPKNSLDSYQLYQFN